MSIYEQARELGNSILETEEAARLSMAQDVYFQDSDAIKRMEEYQNFELQIKQKLEKNEITQQELKTATAELMQMGSALKKDAVTGEYIAAQNAYNSVVASIIDIIRATSQGQDQVQSEEAHKCSGGCGGCGCH